MLRSIQRYAQVALLIAGSAILLYSCDKESVAEEPNDEALMTEYSEHLTMTNTENGRKSYVFTAPLVEGYSLAKEPYQEFRKGVDIVTYQKDSTGAVDATLTANYAIHYGNRKLWEAKGNVVVKNPTDRSSTPSSCSGTRKRAGSGLTSIPRSWKRAEIPTSSKDSSRTIS